MTRSMTQQEAITRVHSALAVIEKLLDSVPDPDDDDLLEPLHERGFAFSEAQALVALLPVAFGRAVLHQHGLTQFVNRARVLKDNGKTTTIYLSDQPLYVAALALGMTYIQDETQAPRAFQLLASYSAELRLLPAMIEAGPRPDSATATAMIFYAEDDDIFVKPPWWRRDLF